MISKADIKLIRSLERKRERDETGMFIAEGEKIINELIIAGWKVEKIFYKEEIGEEMMSRISLLSSPSPVLAVVKKPTKRELTTPEPRKLYLALDSIKDPGNMGTIIRLSDWFGIDAIFCSEDCVDIYNPKVVQSSMGSLFRIKIEYRSLNKLIESNSGKINILGTFLEGENVYDTQMPESAIIVMGSESFGISPDMEKLIDRKISIPSHKNSGAESLNVAIATAIICSEFRRSSASKFQKG